MNRFLYARIYGMIFLLLLSILGYSQTTITTINSASFLSSLPGVVTFAVKNSNTYPIAITGINSFHNIANNGKTYTVWYHTSALTGIPTVSTANGWQQLGTAAPTGYSLSGIIPLVTNKYLIVPPNTTFRFAVSIAGGYMYFGTSTQNTWASSGVSVYTGNSTVSPGYAGLFPTPTSTPATYSGGVIFETAAADNVSALAVVSPVNGNQYCSYDSLTVKVAIRNVGINPQTNFPVTAEYTNLNGTSTITGTYTGTLLPFTNDTVVLGKIQPPFGYTYTAKAYTQLSTDLKVFNDTTPSLSSFVMKPPVPLPIVFNDTICNAVTAFIGVALPQPNTSYKWYDSLSGGTLVNISNNLTFSGLVNDTSFYITSLLNGCESDRVNAFVKVIPPPVLFLPHDTVLCLSKPMTLDAGYPGSHYVWSTGDSTQTLTIATLPGTYWVTMTNYCTVSDTTNITIHPEPFCSGISYIRMGNTYKFKPSSVLNVGHYRWYFGDGTTSTLDTPTHTYSYGVPHPDYNVKLVYGNVCGDDTLYRLVPTGIHDVTELQASINCFPNPANDNMDITSDFALLQDVIIINSVGEVVLKQSFENDTKLSLNLKQLTTGTYFLSIKTNEGNITKPIQIVR